MEFWDIRAGRVHPAVFTSWGTNVKCPLLWEACPLHKPTHISLLSAPIPRGGQGRTHCALAPLLQIHSPHETGASYVCAWGEGGGLCLLCFSVLCEAEVQ